MMRYDTIEQDMIFSVKGFDDGSGKVSCYRLGVFEMQRLRRGEPWDTRRPLEELFGKIATGTL